MCSEKQKNTYIWEYEWTSGIGNSGNTLLNDEVKIGNKNSCNATMRKHRNNNNIIYIVIHEIDVHSMKYFLNTAAFQSLFCLKILDLQNLLVLPVLLQLKVPFFQKVRFFFQISQSPKKVIPKNYPELEIWNFRLYQ